MTSRIRVTSKASEAKPVSQASEDEEPPRRNRGASDSDSSTGSPSRERRARRRTQTSEDETERPPVEEPKKKSSTNISIGSKVKKDEKPEYEDDSRQEQQQTGEEKKRKSSATVINLGSKAKPAKQENDDDILADDMDQGSRVEPQRKTSGANITIGSKAKPSMLNGDVGKAEDLGYEESYNKAKELYGEPPPLNTTFPMTPKVKSHLASWPPTEAKDNEMFTVEGYGKTDPYTKQMIAKEQAKSDHAQQTPYRDTTAYDTSRQKIKPDEPVYTNPALPKDERGEIVDDHVRPVAQLKKKWSGKPQPKRPGVNRPVTNVKEEDSWIKHIKAPVEYDDSPKEPPWKQLVRNRRWKSTIRARFPGKEQEVVEFERRSTTPKNWSRLLQDKKSVRMIGAITGIGAEGEELLWRLASRRGKIEDSGYYDEVLQPREPSETLAYEHMKDNLEAAVYACLEGGERDYVDDDGSDIASIAGTVPSIRSSAPRLSRSSSVTSESGSPKLRRRPLRLAPEEFKKHVALEKSRDATLRWQFSTDPYDSVHENQFLPFELAVLAGEKDRRLRNLLRKLVKPEDLPDSAFSSPPGTPGRRAPYYDSEPEIDFARDGDFFAGRNGMQGRSSRPKKRVPPPPPPRRGRSASPSMRSRMREDEEPIFSAKDLVLSEDLKDEIRKLDQLSQQIQDEDQRTPAVKDTTARIESGTMEESGTRYEKDVPQASIKTGVNERMKSFLKDAQRGSAEEEIKAQRTSEINQKEVRGRRDRMLEIERMSADEDTAHERQEKPRRKVQRMRSDADLHEVFRKRREASDVNVVGDDDDNEASAEMKGLVSDIQETFGEESR